MYEIPRLLVVSVRGSVMLAGLFGMVRGVVQVSFRYMCVVPGLFVVPGLVVIGGGLVILSSVFVMLGCFAVVFCGFFGHLELSLSNDLFGR